MYLKKIHDFLEVHIFIISTMKYGPNDTKHSVQNSNPAWWPVPIVPASKAGVTWAHRFEPNIERSHLNKCTYTILQIRVNCQAEFSSHLKEASKRDSMYDFSSPGPVFFLESGLSSVPKATCSFYHENQVKQMWVQLTLGSSDNCPCLGSGRELGNWGCSFSRNRHSFGVEHPHPWYDQKATAKGD